MCFLVAKLIRRNLFYSSEKVLKLTHSNVGIEKKIPGVTPMDPRFRGRGERGREGRGGRWEGKGEGRKERRRGGERRRKGPTGR